MPFSTAVFPGRYLQGAGALQALPDYLGEKPFIIAGRTGHRYAGGRPVTLFNGECCDEEIDRLVGLGQGSDTVVAIGGGKAIDTAKAVAHALKARTIIAPTIASTDAPTSQVAVIYTPEGAFKRYLFLPRNPDVVLVDTEVIAQAPPRFLVAGMGDALSTWFEADSCRRTRSQNQCGGQATLAALTLARLCYDTLLEHGVSALVACRAGVVTPALEHIVEANTLLSGLGFESGGLGAAHAIHNGLTRLPETHDYYHGEKVAIGVLASLFLTDRPRALIDEVYEFCEDIGLPTTLAQIGVEVLTDVVGEGACAEGETIHHEAGKVTPAEVKAALIAADAYGSVRLLESADC